MKHSIVVKFLVILLTSCCLLASIAGVAGIFAMESAGLYINALDELQDYEYDSIAKSVASAYATYYAVEQMSNLTYAMKVDRYNDPEDRADADHWRVKLSVGDTVLVDPGDVTGYTHVKVYKRTPEYPIISLLSPNSRPPEKQEEEDPDTDTDGDSTENGWEPSYEAIIPPPGYFDANAELVLDGLNSYTLYFYYYHAPEYTVTVYMQEEVLESSRLHLLTTLYPYRYDCIAVVAFGLLLFAAGVVFLCWSAGRDKNGQIHPGGLNLIPLDIYAAAAGIGIWLLMDLYNELIRWINNEGPHYGNLSLLGLNLLAIVLIAIAFLFALSAQIKVRNNYWWRHSLIGSLTILLYRGLRLLAQGVKKLIQMMPVIWQWLLTAVLMFAVVVIFLVLSVNYGSIFIALLILSVLGCLAVVFYGAYAFGILLEGVKKMARGELSHQVPTKYLAGSFRDFAERLNALSGTAMESAQKHLRSERMKTELITNVSHDIKTPLTSIINFVDLLRKDPAPAEKQQYLQILSRQSQQMKRLIDDLIELSKAASGSLTVNLSSMDAAEAVNQALGEFADKLDAAELVPVFRQPEEPVRIMADGRLAWRVLSNLLGNAVKYAMPGTRLYINLSQYEDKVLLSMKNVSREKPDASAEDLMERFVQGDASRSTDGSGLGLNIAKTLMEIQNGRLQLLVDGDLFKVTLVFPAG